MTGQRTESNLSVSPGGGTLRGRSNTSGSKYEYRNDPLWVDGPHRKEVLRPWVH
jgi:hypothetical protein